MTPTQIARKSGIKSKDSLYRALARGQKAGLVRRHALGKSGAYSVDSTSPIFPEVKILVEKLSGFHRELSTALGRLRRVEVAFIYGSTATGLVRADSDVDVLVVGPLSTLEVSRALSPIGSKYGRRLVATTYSRDEIEQRLAAGDPWTENVLTGPKVFLVGHEGLIPPAAPMPRGRRR
jgi:hypothetical protein